MPSYRMTTVLRFPIGSGSGTNTWHFRTGTDFLPDDDLSPITNIVREFYTQLSVIFPPSYSVNFDGSLAEIGTTEPQVVGALAPWSIAGTNTSPDYGPAAAMACVTWRSNLATRSGRGRTFLGPLGRSTCDPDGTLSTQNLQTIRDAASSLVSASNTNNNVGAIGVYSPTDALLRDIVASTVTDQVAVLRSRRS